MAVAEIGRNLRGLVLAAGLVGTTAVPALGAGPESVSDVAAPLLDSVVNISTAKNIEGSRRGGPSPSVPEGSPFQEFFDEFFNERENEGRRPRRVQSVGSGFVVDATGIIVTNNHVIEDGDEITAIFNDGTELVATLVGKDEKTDIAVLKVEPEAPLAAVEFGDSDALRVGDWVMAIGNPFGLGGSVTLGIVSARNRDINSGPYDNFIQTDAAINRGNSGGPLFGMDGKVVGINTAIISPTGGSIGIGFAVPAHIAVGVIEQIREFGETRRGWLGVRIQSITEDMIEGLSLETATGALIAGLTEDGPAAMSGLQAGDVILEFDGETVVEMDDLPRMVAARSIGAEVDVVISRNGEQQTVRVMLGWLEDAERAAEEPPPGEKQDRPDGTEEDSEEPIDPDQPVIVSLPDIGMGVTDLVEELRVEYEIAESVQGALVVAVVEGGAAQAKRIRPGDVIVEMAQETVQTAADVAARLDVLKEEGRSSVRFVIANRDGALRFAVVTITPQ